MVNVETQMDGPILTIKIDTSKSFGRSKSGKSITIATTGGNAKIADVVVGLNVYRPA